MSVMVEMGWLELSSYFPWYEVSREWLKWKEKKNKQVV